MGNNEVGGGKAVFLDRDGVINRNVPYGSPVVWESPRTEADFDLFPWTMASLERLQAENFSLFVVSNQPSYAKGKTTLADLQAIHSRFRRLLDDAGIVFADFFYCFHHPDGVIPELAVPCVCRKPKPHFVLAAIENHGLDAQRSWMIGDRDTDIECGQDAGLRTIQVTPDHPGAKAGRADPDFRARHLEAAVHIVLGEVGT